MSRKKLVENLEIGAAVVTLLVSGFFAGRQLKLCRDAHVLEGQIKTTLDGIDYSDPNAIKVAAHRGFSSKKVENTVPAISEAAIQPYIDSIEIDVRMTKDGCFVLGHDDIIYELGEDEKLEGFEIREVSISDSNYNDLKGKTFIYCNPFTSKVGRTKVDYAFIHCRIHDLRDKLFEIADLTEAIKACGDKQIILDLKIGGNDYEQYIKKLLEVLDDVCKSEGIDSDRIMLACSRVWAARYLKDTSNYKVAIIINKEENLRYCSEFDSAAIKCTLFFDGAVSVSELLSDDSEMHLDNLIIWTPNTSGVLDKWAKTAGTSSLTNPNIIYVTNYPDLIVWRYFDEYAQTSSHAAYYEAAPTESNKKSQNKRDDYLGASKNSFSFKWDNKGHNVADIKKIEKYKPMEAYDEERKRKTRVKCPRRYSRRGR